MHATQHAYCYRCSFCREVLRPMRADVRQCALSLAGVRELQCPHCFGVRIRPWGWLKLLVLPFWYLLRLLRRLVTA